MAKLLVASEQKLAALYDLEPKRSFRMEDHPDSDLQGVLQADLECCIGCEHEHGSHANYDGTDERVYETSKVSLEPVTGTMEMSNTAVPIGGTPNDITVQNTDELAHRQSGQQALTQSDQNSASHGLKTASGNGGQHSSEDTIQIHGGRIPEDRIPRQYSYQIAHDSGKIVRQPLISQQDILKTLTRANKPFSFYKYLKACVVCPGGERLELLDQAACWYTTKLASQPNGLSLVDTNYPPVARYLNTLTLLEGEIDTSPVNHECLLCLKSFVNPLCSMRTEPPVKLPCGHIFGNTCLFIWFSEIGVQHNTCPMCRTKFAIPRPRLILGVQVMKQLQTDVDYLLKELGPTRLCPSACCPNGVRRWEGFKTRNEIFVSDRMTAFKQNEWDQIENDRLERTWNFLEPHLANDTKNWDLTREIIAAAASLLKGEFESPLSTADIDTQSLFAKIPHGQNDAKKALGDILNTADRLGKALRLREAEIRKIDPLLCDCNIDDVVSGETASTACLHPQHLALHYAKRVQGWQHKKMMMLNGQLEASQEEMELCLKINTVLDRPLVIIQLE